MALIRGNYLVLDRCPHCGINLPSMQIMFAPTTSSASGQKTKWVVAGCEFCGGVVLGQQFNEVSETRKLYPDSQIQLSSAIPERARYYLAQAIESLHTPSGSIVMSASAVDAMLKVKGYKEGTLYSRIKLAAEEKLLTDDMSLWAHQIRIDSNNQRHDDEDEPLPTTSDAQKCIDFVLALSEFLFVLPSRVTIGVESSKKKK